MVPKQRRLNMLSPIHRTIQQPSYERICQAPDLQMRTHMAALSTLVSFVFVFGCPWKVAILLGASLVGVLSACAKPLVRPTTYVVPPPITPAPWSRNRCVHRVSTRLYTPPQRAPVGTQGRTPQRRIERHPLVLKRSKMSFSQGQRAQVGNRR